MPLKKALDTSALAPRVIILKLCYSQIANKTRRFQNLLFSNLGYQTIEGTFFSWEILTMCVLS